MSRTFQALLWFFCLPLALIVLIYPPKIHGYLNPYDEGMWLGLAQALIDGKKCYRDVFFHYGPVFPLAISAVLDLAKPTLSGLRGTFWVMNVAGLLMIQFCLLRFVRLTSLRLLLSLAIWSVPLAAHVLTIPMAARYGASFVSILCWSFDKENESRSYWAYGSGLFGALAFWVSQEVGLAVVAAGLVYMSLSQHRNRKWLFMAGCLTGLLIPLALLGSGIKDIWRCTLSQTASIVFRNAFPFPKVETSLFSEARHGIIPFMAALRSWSTLGAVIFPAMSYLAVFGWMLWRVLKRRSPDRFVLALSVYGTLTAATAFTQPDRWHIYFALSPALVLWGYLADHFTEVTFQKRIAAGLVAVIALFLTAPHALISWQKERRFLVESRMSSLARMGVSRLPLPQANGYEALIEEIDRRIPKGQKFLFYPYDGSIYFLADRPVPTYYPVLALAVDEAMQQRTVHDIDFEAMRWVIQDTENNAFKGILIEKFLAPIDQYIKTHFTLKSSLGPFRFLIRTGGALPLKNEKSFRSDLRD